MQAYKTAAEVIQILNQLPPDTEIIFRWEHTHHHIYSEGLSYFPLENKAIFDVEYDPQVS